MSRQPYTRAFKEQAIKLVTQQGYTAAHASRQLSVPQSTLHLWLKEAGWRKPAKPKPGLAAPALSDDSEALKIQVRQLQQLVRRVEMERDILKKATAYFANQNP